MKYLLLLCLLAIVAPSFAVLNRCGYLTENRTIYTQFYDADNGHKLLQVNIDAHNESSGFKWIDVVNDMNKYKAEGVPTPFVYCKVTVNGQTFAAEAERRGDWSRESELPSLKVEFLGKGIKYKEMDRLLLNKHPWDPTRVKNKLSFELLQEVTNMASAYTQFVNLTVNGIPYGLYTMVEDLRDDMLKSHDLKKTSNLYKANRVTWDLSVDDKVLATTSTDPKYDKKKFESFWDIRGAENHTVLIKAYKDIFDANVNSVDAFENNFNVDNYATWLAFVILTGNTDLEFNNFGVYAPKESKNCAWPTPLYMMAWDNDGAWGELDVVVGENIPWNEQGVLYFWNNRLTKRFYQVDAYVDLLQQKMDSLMVSTLTKAHIKSITDDYMANIKPLLEEEPDVSNIAWGASIEDWELVTNAMSSIPAHHYAKHKDLLLTPMSVDASYAFNADSSSLLFTWDRSYIIKNLPFYYELQIATEGSFTSLVGSWITNSSTFLAVPTSLLKPSTTYNWQLIIRNAASPNTYYMKSTISNSIEGGFGFSNFTTPSSLAATSAGTPATLPAEWAIYTDPTTSMKYEYVTLDGASHTATTQTPCATSPISIPDGWMIAPNDALTRAQITTLAKPWANADGLVLADGSRIAPSGKFVDGFGVNTRFVNEVAVTGGKAYTADCSKSNNHILLTKIRGYVSPTSPPASTPSPTTAASNGQTTSAPVTTGQATNGGQTSSIPTQSSNGGAVVVSVVSVLAAAVLSLF